MSEIIGEHKFIASLVLIVSALLTRWIIIRYLKQRPVDEEQTPKRWINRVKNATDLFIVVGLIVIWLFELRYLALSIAAFAVALVIATREYIQSILGAIYQSSTKMFVIGDWIKVGGHYGEVVRNDWFTTVLLEIDMESHSYSYTGKTLVLPNNMFVGSAVTNLNFMRRFVNHSFTIVREADDINCFDMRDYILQKAEEYCEPFGDVAQRYSTLIEHRLGVNIGGPEASVRISTTNLGKNQFEVSIFCPTHEAVTIEQQLTEDFMTFWYQKVEAIKAQEALEEASNAEAATTPAL